MKKAKKSKSRPNFVTTLVLVVLLAVMAIELGQVYGKLHTAKKEQASVAAQVQQLQQQNDALASDLSKAGDEEFIKELARENLDMIDAGGRMFIDPEG